MGNRHKDFDKLLAEKFKDMNFAQSYVVHLLDEEKISLSDALRETIVAMGLQYFAERTGLSIQHVSDFVNGRKSLTTRTIDKYLRKAFRLRVSITVKAIDDDVA